MITQSQTALAVKQSEVIPFSDMERMAQAIAKSGLFGIKTPDAALALGLVAVSENRPFASIATDYDIVQGRPALRAQAALSRFQNAGGKIQWITRNDQECTVEGSHPSGGTLRVTWTIERAAAAGLTGKQSWRQYPCALLSARCVAELVRAILPSCLSGQYLVEEVSDFGSAPTAGKFQAVRASLPPIKEEIIEQEVVQVIESPKVEKVAPLDQVYELADQDKLTEDQVLAFLRSKELINSEVEYLADVKDTLLKRLVKNWPQVIEFAVGASMEEAA